ncbi:MAG: hypothetical protein Kow0031_22340 [Anaerolineae bacterium]
MTTDSQQTRKPILTGAEIRLLISYLLLLILIAGFAVFLGGLAITQHNAYLTNGLDIGNVDQALWNTAWGNFAQFTLMAPVTSRLALHVEPILLLFVPFYWLELGGPHLLLGAQAAVVAFGAWPLYLIALHRFCRQSRSPLLPCSPLWLLIFPLSYLLLPTLQAATLFDFHAVTLAPTFLLFAFLALERGQSRRFWVFAALAMACKEDMPLVVAMMGLYVGLAHHRWRQAGAIVGVSAVWFAVAVFVIQPLAGSGGNIQLNRYAWLGNSPPEMLLTLFTRPALLFDHLWRQANLPAYLLGLLLPTAFLALANPLTLLPALPPLAVNLLSDNPFTWRLEDFHYGAPLAPFLFISAIYGAANVTQWLAALLNKKQGGTPRPAALITPLLILLACTLVYHLHRGFTPLAKPFRWPEVTAHHQRLDDLLAEIPPGAPLFAQSNLAPHLSQRRVLYADFAYFTDPEFPAAEPVEYVALDVTTLENSGGLHQYLQQTLLSGESYNTLAAEDGILIVQAASPPTAAYRPPPPPFYTFARADVPLPVALQADFGDALRLRGYELHFNRQEEVQVTVDLEPLQPLSEVQPVLYLLDAAGRPLGATTDLPAAVAWLPVERWQPGQPLRVRFNTLPWYTRETPVYRLALGIVGGSDPWDISRRLPPVVEPSTPLAVRLPDNGTLLELAEIGHSWRMPEGGPRLRQFSRTGAPTALAANFGNQLELFGHSAPEISSGETPALAVTLYWQALAAPESLVRFVQLIGPDGRVYGQVDSAPVSGQYPTAQWQPGEVVVETVTFPVEASRPPGDTRLHIGLYRPGSGERLPLNGGGDHVEVAVSP